MARRRVAVKREILPDPKYNEETVTRFINKVMIGGKKSISESIVYGSFDIIKEKTGKEPLEVFKAALDNVKPLVETKSRRIGGANYQVPIDVKPVRQRSLAMRWLLEYSLSRSERTMSQKLASEIIDAANNRGNSVKKREDVHKMAAANKAFAHYKW